MYSSGSTKWIKIPGFELPPQTQIYIYIFKYVYNKYYIIDNNNCNCRTQNPIIIFCCPNRKPVLSLRHFGYYLKIRYLRNDYTHRTFGSQLSFMARLAEVCKTENNNNNKL